jgi:Domain of unknown function (DUF4158)
LVVAPVFTDEELESLRRFPEIGRDELARFFTLAPSDVAFINPGRGRGPADRLGLAVALCTLPWLDSCPMTWPPRRGQRLSGWLSSFRSTRIRSARTVIRPGQVTVVKRGAHAREVARAETFDRLAHEFTDERRAVLDGLLVTDPAIGMTRLRWLGKGPVEASTAAVKAEIAKLGFLRGMDAHILDLSVLPAERRRFLATVGLWN